MTEYGIEELSKEELLEISGGLGFFNPTVYIIIATLLFVSGFFKRVSYFIVG